MAYKNKTLGLTMIVKYSEPPEMLKRVFDTVGDYIDEAFITITKDDEKTDTSNIEKLLKLYKNITVSYYIWDDDFASARNYNLSQATTDYIIWLDTDDVVKNAQSIPSIFSDMVDFNYSSMFFPYWYTVETDEKGNITEILVNQKRERIIKNDYTWKWIGELHETLIEQRNDNVSKVGTDKCVVVHLSNAKRFDEGLERNIRILEKKIKKEQNRDPRTAIYLAKTYVDKGKSVPEKERKMYFDMAVVLFNRYLNGHGKPGTPEYLEPSGWREERATAWAGVGEIALLVGKHQIAIEAYTNACREGYEFPSYYIDLAMTYCLMQDYKRAKQYLRIGINTPMPDTTIVTFPKDLKLRSLQVSMDINLNTQNLEEAKKDAEMIAELDKKDTTIKEKIRTIDELIKYNKACQSFVYLGKYLERKKDKAKIADLVRAIPSDMQRERFASQMRHIYLPKKVWANNEITIICGPGYEKWSPKSLQTGIGGSEEAVIRLSKELTALGWKVTVYADPGEDAGVYDGVEYKDWYELNQKDTFNVLILWRAIGFIDFNPNSKFTLLWLHDVPNCNEFTTERVDKIDKIAVLSDYHESLLRLFDKGAFKPMPTNKVFKTANGIPELTLEWKGNPHRMIYMSSPDRGLVYLLKHWSKIIKEVPDAELHIYYGFNIYDKVSGENPARKQWKEDVMKMMQQQGITYHGRVGHEALHYEISKSGIWAYSSNFEEIFCINGALAQALGAIPVTTTIGALNETVKNGIKVDVDIEMEEGQDEYIKALITALKDEKWQQDVRPEMMKWARGYFSWKNTVSTWDELFKVGIQNTKKPNVIEEAEIIKTTKKPMSINSKKPKKEVAT